jgi:hypothetical protein
MTGFIIAGAIALVFIALIILVVIRDKRAGGPANGLEGNELHRQEQIMNQAEAQRNDAAGLARGAGSPNGGVGGWNF